MNHSYILLIGHSGTGKSSLSMLLKQEGWKVISAGDTIRTLAKELGYSISRKELQKFGNQLLIEKGEYYFADILANQMHGANQVIFEGIRPVQVICELKKIIPELFIVFIESDSETRFFRLYEQEGLTRDEFNALEIHFMEKQVEHGREIANCVLDNNGHINDTFEALKNAIK